MTDFRPSDHVVVPTRPQTKTAGGWASTVFTIALIAAAGWVYQFRPQWLARIYDFAGMSRIDISEQGDQPDTKFGALYQRYGMPPLGGRAASNYSVKPLLAILQKEPCDRQNAYEASVALENIRAIRGAAELMKGFAELYHASELYYLLGDYDTAVKLSSDLINQHPDAQYPYFVRAKSEQGLKQYAAAIEDYATLIRLLPDTKSIVSEVFTRMSESYEKLDRPCEAIGPLQTYIALDNEKRSTPALLKRIATLAANGNCAQVYAKGFARIPRRSNGVSVAKVEINGVEGRFVFDTGASFVALTRAFADKVKPRTLTTDSVEIQTANGTTSAALASLDSVKLAGISASAVPAVVTSKSLGDDIDGLLGMSFLSRFTVVIEDREIQLKAKTLGE
jgi:aspartyl protease family protein